jgi:hypothetical protein
MKLIINKQQSFEEISNSFTKTFPFLKLEFFSRKHLSGEASSNQFLIPKELTPSDCRTVYNTDEITITPDMKVGELEELFSATYGLGLQVYRKSGRVWLETTATDSWTLTEQNIEGEFLSKKTDPDEPVYYQDVD